MIWTTERQVITESPPSAGFLLSGVQEIQNLNFFI